ncbi:MAG TPA: hypothetical protein VFL64_17035 [Rhizobacter sp.]|nr:hypothetical protein [Rhizobacter sp.]
MSDDDFFAPPAFKPAEALVALKRQLRDLKPLVERGTGFEIGGKRVIELAASTGSIDARLAKRPAVSPEWQPFTLKNSADVRKLVDEVKKRLARWQQDAE